MTIAEKITRAKTDYDEVYEAGKKAEYDRFWDNYQSKGEVVNYTGAFHGLRWDNEVFTPKYDIKPSNAYMMFRESNIKGDLVEILSALGVKLDFSACTILQYTFTLCRITRIGTVYAPKAVELADTFSYSYYLETIDKIIIGENQRCNNSCFHSCSALKNITFEGIIGNSINFQWCPLSKASITNIIEHLSGTATGQTCTFNKAAKETAFTDDEWSALIGTKTNWTFSLV